VWFSILRPPPSWILLCGQSYSGTSFSVSVSHLVWIRSKMVKLGLWPFNCFQDGCRPPSWIYFRCQIFVIWSSLSGGYGCSCKISYVYISIQYTADLLSFVKKYKMAAAAIMNFYLATLDHPWSLLHGPNIVLKFHFNRITTFQDMAIWKFCKFGLKRLFPSQKCFFGGFASKHNFSSSRSEIAKGVRA